MFQFNFKVDEAEKNHLINEEPEKTLRIDPKSNEEYGTFGIVE